MGVPRQFPRYLQFCVFFLCLKLGIINCFCQQALERAQMFKGPANLGKFHRRKRDKSYSKDPYFLCRKTLINGIGLRCLSTRRLSNLAPFGNLSHGVFFSFNLFFRCKRPMNIKRVVAGNPRFHHIKTVLS